MKSGDSAVGATKLTKRVVDGLRVPASGEAIHWDRELKGFGIRISHTGRRSYFVHTRTKAGKQVKMTIGVHGPMTADQAREQAAFLLGQYAVGHDPSEALKAARRAERARREAPTLTQLAADYLQHYAFDRKRASSMRDDVSMIGMVILPRLAHVKLASPARLPDGQIDLKDFCRTIEAAPCRSKVADVRHADIEALHRGMKSTPYRANRVIALLSKMFSLAIKWTWRTDNPVRGIERYPESKRERFLTAEELKRLADALGECTNKVSAGAVKMMLLTGARRGEVLNAEWNQFDLKAGVWTKPSSHTKQKKVHRVPLSPAALSVLQEMERYKKTGDDHVFPGRKAGKPIQDIKKFWASVCNAANLQGIRIHDLRHSFASLLASSGKSLPIIGALLGHTQPATTARYSHLLDEPLREATGRVGAIFEALTEGRAAAVIPIGRARR